MKKIVYSVLFTRACLFCVYAKDSSINAKIGYRNLTWNDSLSFVKMSGYEITPVTDDILESEQKNFKQQIKIYNVSGFTDKAVDRIWLYFVDDKLFSIIEKLNKTCIAESKLGKRYGGISAKSLHLVDKNYYSDSILENNKVVNQNIEIRVLSDNALTTMYNWEIYSKINRNMLKKTGRATIADNLYEFSIDLLKKADKNDRISMAFIALTSDAKNSFVENYVTDAITQAVYEHGNVKIVERANVQKLLDEQLFQASGYVDDDSAKSIGKLAGVDYVCYGDMKDIGNQITINSRIVDVESGEVVAISRTTVDKDTYLKDYAIAQKREVEQKKQEDIRKKDEERKALEKKISSYMWRVTKNVNSFDESEIFTFIVPCSGDEYLILGYCRDKNQSMSYVRAGASWGTQYYNSNGTYDIKCSDGNIVTKKYNDAFYWSVNDGRKSGGNTRYSMSRSEKESARFFYEMLLNNNELTIKKGDSVRKFKTEGLADILKMNGITLEEIDAAIANEEF